MLLDETRQKIDKIDRQLIDLLEKRMELVDQVADYKKQHHIAVFDQKREEEIFKKIIKNVKKQTYQETVVETFKAIMTLSKKFQEKRMKNDN